MNKKLYEIRNQLLYIGNEFVHIAEGLKLLTSSEARATALLFNALVAHIDAITEKLEGPEKVRIVSFGEKIKGDWRKARGCMVSSDDEKTEDE